MTMSRRVARGWGAAASHGLDDASSIACGRAPNIAPSSCNADPAHFPDRLLNPAERAQDAGGVNGVFGDRAPKGASASLMAFITAAGAPPRRPRRALGAELGAGGGVTTWPHTMSGISAAIGTR